MASLAGKTALVTGAMGGIGQAIVARLQADGATVVAADLSTAGTKADHGIDGDLTDTAFADGLPAQVQALTGRLDILCNNAGIIARGKITEATDEDLRRSLADQRRGALSPVPRRHPDHGRTGRRRLDRQHRLVLGAATRSQPSDLHHDQGGAGVPDPVPGAGITPGTGCASMPSAPMKSTPPCCARASKSGVWTPKRGSTR